MTRLQAAGILTVPAEVPTLAGVVALCDRALNEFAEQPASAEARQAIDRARRLADELMERGERLGALADDLIEETEFGFLFNSERQLFSIGFSVTGRPPRQLALRHRSRPRRGSRASWRSRPVRCRTSTGSSSDGR